MTTETSVFANLPGGSKISIPTLNLTLGALRALVDTADAIGLPDSHPIREDCIDYGGQVELVVGLVLELGGDPK